MQCAEYTICSIVCSMQNSEPNIECAENSTVYYITVLLYYPTVYFTKMQYNTKQYNTERTPHYMESAENSNIQYCILY